MNIYLVVEGSVGEKKVYSCWLKYIDSRFNIVNSINEISTNSAYIIAGFGYPNYFDVIESAAYDVMDHNIDRLVVAIDSEDMTYNEKHNEIETFIDNLNLNINYKVIVQHFCLETWALGNRIIVNRKPSNTNVRKYLKLYDVLTLDPANLPSYPEEGLNRAQFAEKYLRALLNDKYRNLTYTKHNPSALLHDLYYKRVLERFNNTGHISSFNDFLTAFV